MAGDIALEFDNITVGEDDADGLVDIRILRSGDLSGTVTVYFATESDTAEAGVDFSDIYNPDADHPDRIGSITFQPDQVQKKIQIPIINDTLAEGNEDFVFKIVDVEGGFLTFPRTAIVTIVDDEAPGGSGDGGGDGPPYAGLTMDLVPAFSGLRDKPMTIAWADSDTALVAEKGGLIEVFEAGVKQTTPFLDITAEVNNDPGRGMMDMALDPNFGPASQGKNPYIYVTYVYDDPQTANYIGDVNAEPDGSGNRPCLLTRFEVAFDAAGNPTHALPETETILLGQPGVWGVDYNPFINSNFDLTAPPSGVQNWTGADNDYSDDVYLKNFIPDDSVSHSPGDIEFGPDGLGNPKGALYVTIGDGTSFNSVDFRSLRVQDIDSLSGKVLRIDPETGLGISTNPFFNSAEPDSNASKVYQLGLRNGFRTFLDDETGQLYIGHVGWSKWETIDVGGPGANFGWPFYEGGDQVALITRLYRDHPEAQAFYNEVAAGLAEVTASYRGFSHQYINPGPDLSAIMVGDKIRSDVYPDVLQNNLLFADITSGRIFALNLDDPDRIEHPLTPLDSTVTEGRSPVDIVRGPDGYMYVVSLLDKVIYRLEVSVDNQAINGTNTSETLTGGVGNDTIIAKGGDDFVLADYGNDSLMGNLGNDTLDGSNGDDTLYGGPGDDSLLGSFGRDTISGDAGNDTLGGGDEDDRLIGANGDDSLIGGDGNDTLLGGAGNDSVLAGRGDDSILGGDGDDSLRGFDGNDTIDCGTGADSASGDAGNDTVKGANGNDTLGGGDGDDSLNGGDGDDSLAGQAGNDTILGGTGNDTIAGGDGDDSLIGGDGHDQISGDLGNDTLIGSAGNDTLDGSDGDDLLSGDAGTDWLIGGSGDDRFRFSKVTDSPAGTGDHIVGFDGAGVAGGDLILLAGIDADSGVGGNQTFVFIGTVAFSGTARELRVFDVGDETVVQGDVNGDRVADLEIHIADGVAVVAANYIAGDFVL